MLTPYILLNATFTSFLLSLWDFSSSSLLSRSAFSLSYNKHIPTFHKVTDVTLQEVKMLEST